MAQLLDYDPVTGLRTVMHKEAHSGKFHIQVVQDVSQYLRQNASERASQSQGFKGEMHKVASIPPIVWDRWWKELGDNPGAKRNRKWLVSKLNSNDFCKLRTKDGRI